MSASGGFWNGLAQESAQVLICDLQDQIVARSKTVEPETLGQSAAVLCQIAALFHLPVTLSVVPEQENPPKLISELEQNAAGAPQFLRASASPFTSAETREALAANQRQTLIVAGFATEVVVLHTALDGLKAGYQVIVAVDACGGMSERTESAAIEQIRIAGGLIASVVSIATALSPDFSTEQGKQMFQIVQQLRLA